MNQSVLKLLFQFYLEDVHYTCIPWWVFFHSCNFPSLKIAFLLIFTNSRFCNLVQKTHNERSSSTSKDPALHFNYCPQKPLATDMIQKAQERYRGPRDFWADLCRAVVVGWHETLESRREDHARRRASPHPLPSHWKPIEVPRSWINPQREKPGMIHSHRHPSMEGLKDVAIQKERQLLNLLPFACCRWPVYDSWGFFLLFLWKCILHNGSLFFFLLLSVIFWSHTML